MTSREAMERILTAQGQLTDPVEVVKITNRAWKYHHPAAAAEAPSAPLEPLRLTHTRGPEEHKSQPDEVWGSEMYNVTLRRIRPDPVFGSKMMLVIGVNSNDQTARHDWRDMQAIKNQLAGPEVEGFEIFPAESRKTDPSNYYLMYCFPHIGQLRVGLRERRVWNADDSLAPQRGFIE